MEASTSLLEGEKWLQHVILCWRTLLSSRSIRQPLWKKAWKSSRLLARPPRKGFGSRDQVGCERSLPGSCRGAPRPPPSACQAVVLALAADWISKFFSRGCSGWRPPSGREAVIKSAASAASPEGFQAVIKSAASAASPATKMQKNRCFLSFLGPLYRDSYIAGLGFE